MPDFSPEHIVQHYTLQLFLCSGLLTLSSTNFGEWARRRSTLWGCPEDLAALSFHKNTTDTRRLRQCCIPAGPSGQLVCEGYGLPMRSKEVQDFVRVFVFSEW